jgi:hypothetical protein
MYLFLSGEFFATLPIVMKTSNWIHTTKSRKLFINDDGTIRRECVRENIKGIIYHADVEDKDIEQHNLCIIKQAKIPCWPPIDIIEPMLDRFTLLNKCNKLGLLNHEIVIVDDYTTKPLMQFPYVLKVGNVHRGEGKYLINNNNDIPIWEGKASAEPFFKGESYRVFVVGDTEFVIKIDNTESWIRNSVGGEVSVVKEPINGLIKHARKVCELFKLELAGIDYIVKNREFHFLEANIFPGLNYGDETKNIVDNFLKNKMNLIEQSSI